MNYQISRNGQIYGPYTIEDLQRYLASGHVLPNDLAKSEDMPDWLPVSHILSSASGPTSSSIPGSIPSPTSGSAPYGSPVPGGYPPAGFAPPSGLASANAAPNPPDLHWGLVLLFDLLTCSLFQMVWNIILASWFRRVFPGTKAFLLYIASAILICMQAVMGQSLGFLAGRHGYNARAHAGSLAIYSAVATVSWVIRLVTRFTFRSELEHHYNTVEPIGLRINPVLTFFFGGLYLQSQMNKINAFKRGQRYL